jgi:two-component system, cell cycle response regulator DivK
LLPLARPNSSGGGPWRHRTATRLHPRRPRCAARFCPGERILKRVLIVDDIEEQRDIYATLLGFHGYHVLEAEDGESAVALATRDRPDVILMDVMLPGLDGWKATERLKSDPRTSMLPVIILTSRALSADVEKSSAAGADVYLSKPCDPRRILQEIQRLIGTPSDEK